MKKSNQFTCKYVEKLIVTTTEASDDVKRLLSEI